MKLPRDVSANQLIKALRVLGYSIDHQRGSHIRIATQLNGQHHETIPNQGGHSGAHFSEHRQTSQCHCGRLAIAIGFVTMRQGILLFNGIVIARKYKISV
jgi:predicted RNA binding protein YcfA (HicA-like mRNA interferase family)